MWLFVGLFYYLELYFGLDLRFGIWDFFLDDNCVDKSYGNYFGIYVYFGSKIVELLEGVGKVKW